MEEKMNITIWTQQGNRESEQADFALRARHIDFTERKIGVNATLEEFLTEFPNTNEFPQVIIDNTKIGSYKALENYLIHTWTKPNE